MPAQPFSAEELPETVVKAWKRRFKMAVVIVSQLKMKFCCKINIIDMDMKWSLVIKFLKEADPWMTLMRMWYLSTVCCSSTRNKWCLKEVVLLCSLVCLEFSPAT